MYSKVALSALLLGAFGQHLTLRAATAVEVDVDEVGAAVDALFAAETPPPGKNVDGGSVASNFLTAYRNGQFFQRRTSMTQYEKPGTDQLEGISLMWCSNLSFTDFFDGAMPMAYTGHCMYAFLLDPAPMIANGAQITGALTLNEFSSAYGISAVFVPQTNVFEGGIHRHTDNWIWRFWDDGRSSMVANGWEVMDEGDKSPNAVTSSWSSVAKHDWLTVDEAASLLNVDPSEFTPEKFSKLYAQVWTQDHENALSISSPYPDAAREAIDKVKSSMLSEDFPKQGGADSSGVPDESDGETRNDTSGGGRRILHSAVAGNILSSVFRLIGL